MCKNLSLVGFGIKILACCEEVNNIKANMLLLHTALCDPAESLQGKETGQGLCWWEKGHLSGVMRSPFNSCVDILLGSCEGKTVPLFPRHQVCAVHVAGQFT